MENKSHAYAAGIFVLTVAGLLLTMTIWLLPDTVDQRVFEISTRDAVNGLRPQAFVRYRGVMVGRVSAIEFDPEVKGNVLITLSVDDQAPITSTTYATLAFQGVTGLAFVQLDDAGNLGTTLPTSKRKPTRLPMRPGLIARLGDQGGEILNQLAETSRRINQLLAPENQQQIVGTVEHIGQAALGVQQLVGSVDKLVRRQLDPARVDLAQLSREATATLRALQLAAGRAADSAEDIRRSASSLTRLADQLGSPGGAVERVGDGAGALASVGQSLNASTLPRLNRATEETGRTVRQVGRLAEVIKDQPQALLFGTTAPLPGPGEPGFTAPPGQR